MKKYSIFALLLLAGFTFWYYQRHPLETRIEIDGHRFTVELAVTPEEQHRGLGYRDALADGRGMLFVYQNKDRYGYWMKGMRFPIDIIWVNDLTIVDISEHVPVASGSMLPTYTPREPVNKVLELNAGTVEKLGIQIGDTIQILKR